MMVAITPKVGRSMVKQVERVNKAMQAQQDTSEIDRLVALLDQYRKENATLKERLASYEDSSSNHVADSGVMLGTRPTITQGEAARRAGVSVATANRYLNTGYWQGVQMSGNRWFVFADQALKKKKV